MHVGQSERSVKDVDFVLSDGFSVGFRPDLVYVGKPVTNYKGCYPGVARQLKIRQQSHAKVLFWSVFELPLGVWHFSGINIF